MLNIGVVYGSRTCEHEVSIISALQLIKAADKEKYNIIPIYISKQGEWFTGDSLLEMSTYVDFDPLSKNIKKVTLDITPGSNALIYHEKAKGLFGKETYRVLFNLDCVIPVMHGLHGEDGTLQGLFELANIPYASSGVASCSIGMDKVIMKRYFRGLNFPVLDDIWFTVEDWNDKLSVIKQIESKFNYPVFIKPANLGSSIGVSKANDENELKEALEVAFTFDRKVLIEKAINNPMELNCSVLGDDRKAQASVIEMPVTGGNLLGFIEKYISGSSSSKGMASLKRIVPAPIEETLTKELQDLSLNVFRELDCKGVVRIDYMYDVENSKYYITEINIIPGSLSFYLWEQSGINYKELVDILIDIAMYAHNTKQNINYTYSSDILKSGINGKKGIKGKL